MRADVIVLVLPGLLLGACSEYGGVARPGPTAPSLTTTNTSSTDPGPAVDEDGDGYDPSDGDCDDDDPDVHEGAEEIGWDGIDQDCDGRDVYDFDQVCGGDAYSCGIDTLGRVHCWGEGFAVQYAPALDEGPWSALACGGVVACAVGSDGTWACWGTDHRDYQLISRGPEATAALQAVSQVAVGRDHACMLDDSGEHVCWGRDDAGQVSNVSAGATFREISVGRMHTCGLAASSGQLTCWGAEGSGDLISSTPNTDRLAGIVGGVGFACGIGSSIVCWGDYEAELPVGGRWSMLAAGDRFLCGLDDGAPWCGVDGPDTHEVEAALPTNTPLRFIGAGSDHVCAIRSADGELDCWGRDDRGQATVPDFSALVP